MSNVFSGPFDIFVQAGQSNAEGCGQGTAAEPFVPTEQILYMNKDLSLSVAAERELNGGLWSDFSLFFASEYVKAGWLDPSRRVLILRTAVGGTGFLDRRWGMTDDLFLQMVKMIQHAKTLHEDSRFAALLWHQGETDAILTASYEGHYNNLSGLIDAVRAETGVSDLPFVAGDFVQHWKRQNMGICEPVVTAIRHVCRDKAGHFVETDGLMSNDQTIGNGDHIHFSTPSLEILGRKYFEAIFG